jgi:flagellar basal body-associated protein FliL
MADAKKEPAKEAPKEAATEAKPEAPKKGGLPIKLLGGVAVVMVVEAAAVFFVAKATGPKHAQAEEVHVEGADQTDHEATAEIPLIEEKFQNLQTGRVWIWDTEIYVKVRQKNEEYVSKVLENRSAEIKEGVSMLFRRAQHSQLKEPGMETLTRQLNAYLMGIVGKDAEGKERMERVVIPKCRGFPAD